MRPVHELSVVQDDTGVQWAFPSRELDAAPGQEQAQRARDVRTAAQLPARRDVLEDLESLRLPEVERVHGDSGRPAKPGGEGVASVEYVDPVGIHRRRPYLEPSLRAEDPPPTNVRVAFRAHGVDPDLAHVLHVDVLEVDHPQLVGGVRKRRRLGAFIAEGGGREARDGWQRRDHLRGRIRGVEPQSCPDREAARA